MMLLSDGGNALQPFLLAAFPERCARGCGRARPRTPRAASECIASARALFAVIPGKCLKSESAWRSEVNSNCRYRFLNSPTTAPCQALGSRRIAKRVPRTAFMMRWFLSLEAAEPKWGCLSLGPSCRISRRVAHAHEEKASLERCEGSA
jgi:hypothetical protein